MYSSELYYYPKLNQADRQTQTLTIQSAHRDDAVLISNSSSLMRMTWQQHTDTTNAG
jgi:hypothetical protein